MNGLRERVAEYGVDIDFDEGDAARLAAEHTRVEVEPSRADFPNAVDLIQSKAYEWIGGVFRTVDEDREVVRAERPIVEELLSAAITQETHFAAELQKKQRLVEETEAIGAASASGPHWWVRPISTWLYVAILGVIGGFSYFQNASAFEVFTDGPGAIVSAFFFAALELVATHGAGHGFAQPAKTKRRSQFVPSVVLLGLIVLAVIAVGVIRADYLAGGVGGAAIWEWPSLQAFVVGTGLFASYRHANIHADAHDQANKQLAAAMEVHAEAKGRRVGLQTELADLKEAEAALVYQRIVDAYQILDYVPVLANTYKLVYFRLSKGRLPVPLQSQVTRPDPPPIMTGWIDWVDAQQLDRPKINRERQQPVTGPVPVTEREA